MSSAHAGSLRNLRLALPLALPLALLLWLAPAGHAQIEQLDALDALDALDCAGPVADAEPGTVEWQQRDAQNMLCAVQRHADKPLHPVSPLPVDRGFEGLAPPPMLDAYREPERHAGTRFRFTEATVTNRSGDGVSAELYRPCAPGSCAGMPEDLQAAEPPYPGVVVLHGGSSRKELHWWSSQTLAEAGYMVVAFDGAAGNHENAEDVLDWLLATPRAPTGAGEHNPFWDELDRRRIGLAGHSQGGQTASVFGQEDRRVAAIVAWDRGVGQQLPDELDTPTLFFVSDYECQANPICQPEPYLEPPEGEGPGQRGREYELVRAAGVDALKVTLRASAHLDWTPSWPAGNRYVETVSVYYTIAWFDRYLRGRGDPRTARDAFGRLTAERFDDSADRHNVSQGLFDPARAAADPTDPYAGNAPYLIEGVPVANLLSFYFSSRCQLTTPPGIPGRRVVSDDIRGEGCGGG